MCLGIGSLCFGALCCAGDCLLSCLKYIGGKNGNYTKLAWTVQQVVLMLLSFIVMLAM